MIQGIVQSDRTISLIESLELLERPPAFINLGTGCQYIYEELQQALELSRKNYGY